MRALVLTSTGGPEVLQVQDRPDPVAGPGQVRIAVRAAGINFADTLARVGLYPDAPKPPCVLGYEVAGEVESVGEGVSDYSVGDRVMALTRFGGQAELVAVPVEQVLALPEALSFEQGAAFPVNYGTAYAALIVMGGMKSGERVLIHAAAGGVGTAATQIARNAGAEIFGTASASKHEEIRRQGVDSRDRLPQRRLRRRGDADHRRRGHRPGDRRDRPNLVPQGLSAAAARGAVGDVRPLGVRRRAGQEPARDPEEPREDAPGDDAMVAEPDDDEREQGHIRPQPAPWWDREGGVDRLTEPLVADLEAGRIEPLVAASFPFEQAGEAHRYIAERRNIGKVVLFPSMSGRPDR